MEDIDNVGGCFRFFSKCFFRQREAELENRKTKSETLVDALLNKVPGDDYLGTRQNIRIRHALLQMTGETAKETEDKIIKVFQRDVSLGNKERSSIGLLFVERMRDEYDSLNLNPKSEKEREKIVFGSLLTVFAKIRKDVYKKTERDIVKKMSFDIRNIFNELPVLKFLDVVPKSFLKVSSVTQYERDHREGLWINATIGL